jgi:hypothetical protein
VNKRFSMLTVALAVGGLFLGGCALNGYSESQPDPYSESQPDPATSDEQDDKELCTWVDGKLQCEEDEDVGTAEDAIQQDDPGVGCQTHPDSCRILNWP